MNKAIKKEGWLCGYVSILKYVFMCKHQEALSLSAIHLCSPLGNTISYNQGESPRAVHISSGAITFELHLLILY